MKWDRWDYAAAVGVMVSVGIIVAAMFAGHH